MSFLRQMFAHIKSTTKETRRLKQVSCRKNCSWLSMPFIIIYLFLLVCFSMNLVNLKMPGWSSALRVRSPSPPWAQTSLELREAEGEVVLSGPSLLALLVMLVILGCYTENGWLKQRNIFSHSSGGLKAKIQVPAGVIFSYGSSPWLVNR